MTESVEGRGTTGNKALSSLKLRPGHGRPRAPRAHRMLPNFALPNSIAAKGEQCVQIPAADRHSGDPGIVWHRKDDLRWAVVRTDLYAAFSRKKLASLDRVAHGFRPRVVLPVVDVQVEETLFVHERTILLHLIAVSPL